jgi:hypothetical protein
MKAVNGTLWTSQIRHVIGNLAQTMVYSCEILTSESKDAAFGLPVMPTGIAQNMLM